MFKAGWRPISQELYDEFFPGIPNHRAWARTGSLIKAVKKWLRREGISLFFAHKMYYIPNEEEYPEAARQSMNRLLPKTIPPQAAIYLGMEKYSDNKEIMQELEMIDLSLVTGVLNRRQLFLAQKINENRKDCSDENKA